MVGCRSIIGGLVLFGVSTLLGVLIGHLVDPGGGGPVVGGFIGFFGMLLFIPVCSIIADKRR